jgi:molybdopterin adenylyltransferase
MTIRVSILTISDRSSRGERPDSSGTVLVDKAREFGWELVNTGLVPDEIPMIAEKLVQWCDARETDVILTTGGTGFTPRDVTPEATLSVVEKLAPGIAEAMRINSLKITPHAMLSRAVAGIRGRTLIVNFPGSPKAAVENLEFIAPVIPHAVELLSGSPSAEAGHSLKSST